MSVPNHSHQLSAFLGQSNFEHFLFRLSLLEQKRQLESECLSITERLRDMSVTSPSSEADPLRHARNPSTSKGVDRPGSRFAAHPRSVYENKVDSKTTFLSDVSPEKEEGSYSFQRGAADVARSSTYIGHLKSQSRLSQQHIPRSHSFKSNLLSVNENSASKEATLYENLRKFSPETSPRVLQSSKSSEEHNNREPYYEPLLNEESPEVVRHDRDDSGVVAFYENILSSIQKTPVRDQRGDNSLSEHKRSLSSESSSNASYYSSLKCKILIDIKFTVDDQLHVRLEELKDLTLLQSLAGLQFSVELYSLDDPSNSVCQCSGFEACNEFEISGKLIVNEFMTFALPYNGKIDSCFLRVIMFCRPRTNSQYLPENFLVRLCDKNLRGSISRLSCGVLQAELNLNLASVFLSQQASKFKSTSNWYQLVMNGGGKVDFNSWKEANRPAAPQLPIYDAVYDSAPIPMPRSQSAMAAAEKHHHTSQFSPVKSYPTAHYSVKNTTVAKLQPLNEYVRPVTFVCLNLFLMFLVSRSQSNIPLMVSA